ncbi:MAG: hypothetical protein JRD89_03335 [Deltaproteobacteria bacterium]|nr:hypothetical protein [Deltaproteobacteria bacterium]
MLIILAIGSILAFGVGLNYHFIRLDDDLKVLKKTELTFDKTFVEARGAKKIKLFLDPTLVKAGVKDLLKDIEK